MEEIEKFIDELKADRDRRLKFYSEDSDQELYMQVANKLGNLLLSIEKVENNGHCRTFAYYEDVLFEVRVLELLENKYPNEWPAALKKAVGMFLQTALNQINSTKQEDKDFFINRAIYALWFCKNKDDLKRNFYNKIKSSEGYYNGDS